ncbi:hypothetical protein TL16_g11440, partial [Triparma laevis f. inornata]
DFFDQSLDEIKILKILNDAGDCDSFRCLKMIEFFYYKEHLVIVTELLKLNLYEFQSFINSTAEEPYFTLPRIAYIAYQVLIALDYVHRLGILHCDVKPENILLQSYSRVEVKLIDFGSGCFMTDHLSSYIQSRSYRAPEVILGLGYTGKIDVWSLGCVIAEMWNGGEVLFENDSVPCMLARIQASCGTVPKHMLGGSEAGRFFSPSGLVYEEAEEGGGSSSLRAQLGFDDADEETGEVEGSFIDFVEGLLRVDPDTRLDAQQALAHPFIVNSIAMIGEDQSY